MSWWDNLVKNTKQIWNLYKTQDTQEDLRSDYVYRNNISGYSSRDPIWKQRMSTVKRIPNRTNKFGPYLTEFTEKSLKPLNNVRIGEYANLSNGAGSTIPANWANQRAGSNSYVMSQQQQVFDYVSNPSNGWRRLAEGTFFNDKTGQMYNHRLATSGANNPVSYYMDNGLDPLYFTGKRYIQVPSKDTDAYSRVISYIDSNAEAMRQASGDIIDFRSSSLPTTIRPLTPRQINTYDPVGATVHEVNHAYTSPIIANGIIKKPIEIYGDVAKSSIAYQENPLELGNTASLFQQQHYRNTGRRIVDKNKFWDDINNAKYNIKDYDPESRRFLQSLDILQNEAHKNPRAADMLMQIQEAMPLITNNGYNRNYRNYV